MAQEKKYLDQEGLAYFWQQCRLRDQDNFQTNLEIFDAFAQKLNELETKTGVESLNDGTSLAELLQEHKDFAFKDISINDKNQMVLEKGNGNKVVIDFHQANAQTLGLVKLYEETGENTDGTVTQKAITDLLNEKVGVSYSEGTLIFIK